jgi:hypothetical protein
MLLSNLIFVIEVAEVNHFKMELTHRMTRQQYESEIQALVQMFLQHHQKVPLRR